MDILSHGLWAVAIARGANLKTGKRVMRSGLAFFFGIFPDVFAFAIPTLVMLWGFVSGDASLSTSSTSAGPPSLGSPAMLSLAYSLYNLSHSLVVFAIVFLVIAFVRGRRPLWELSGWLFHILCDIPTHSGEFFPTPVFWPLSDWRFDGFSWGRPWFILANYGALLLVHLFLTWKSRSRKQPSPPPYATP